MAVNKLEIISLNDASTSITGIKVNRGNCPVGSGDLTEHALWQVAGYLSVVILNRSVKSP
jgi:hypothetical protein